MNQKSGQNLLRSCTVVRRHAAATIALLRFARAMLVRYSSMRQPAAAPSSRRPFHSSLMLQQGHRVLVLTHRSRSTSISSSSLFAVACKDYLWCCRRPCTRL
jgi:hypothetical protein